MKSEERMVALTYAALTVVMTWPLGLGIGRDLPADLGDSLLSIWIIDWVGRAIVGVLTGAMGPRDIWNANIFHPEPLALGFSETFFAQALQVLPLRALSNNLILLYNLLFLSTFLLSALGAPRRGRRDPISANGGHSSGAVRGAVLQRGSGTWCIDE